MGNRGLRPSFCRSILRENTTSLRYQLTCRRGHLDRPTLQTRPTFWRSSYWIPHSLRHSPAYSPRRFRPNSRPALDVTSWNRLTVSLHLPVDGNIEYAQILDTV